MPEPSPAAPSVGPVPFRPPAGIRAPEYRISRRLGNIVVIADGVCQIMRRQVRRSWETHVTRRRNDAPDASWSRPGSAHLKAAPQLRSTPSARAYPGQRIARGSGWMRPVSGPPRHRGVPSADRRQRNVPSHERTQGTESPGSRVRTGHSPKSLR